METLTLNIEGMTCGGCVKSVTRILEGVEGVKDVRLNLVFEPEWDRDMMSEEAKLDLGFL